MGVVECTTQETLDRIHFFWFQIMLLDERVDMILNHEVVDFVNPLFCQRRWSKELIPSLLFTQDGFVGKSFMLLPMLMP